jgi:hypothetical protein
MTRAPQHSHALRESQAKVILVPLLDLKGVKQREATCVDQD